MRQYLYFCETPPNVTWTLPDLLHLCWVVDKLAVQGALVLSSELVPEQLQLILYMPQVLTTR